MKTFRTVFLVLLFAVFNYYGVKFTFLGLNYAGDYAFIGGLCGGAVLLVLDILIIRSVINRFAAKVEAAWQDEQIQPEAQQGVGQSISTDSQPQVAQPKANN